MISLIWSPYTHCTRHLFPHLISLPARANFSDITNENLLWHLINNWKLVDQHRVRVMEKSIAFHTLRISIDQCNGLVGDRHSGVPTPWQLVCQALRHAVRLLVWREKLETELSQSSQICPLAGHWHPAMTACPRRHSESPLCGDTTVKAPLWRHHSESPLCGDTTMKAPSVATPQWKPPLWRHHSESPLCGDTRASKRLWSRSEWSLVCWQLCRLSNVSLYHPSNSFTLTSSKVDRALNLM